MLPVPSSMVSAELRTRPVRASTQVFRRLGVWLARMPVVVTCQARRGVPSLAYTTRAAALDSTG